MTNARELTGRRRALPRVPSLRIGCRGLVSPPVPIAGESGLACLTCQAVTGFAHDFRDDAARADPVRPAGEPSGPPEAELG
jgi:hypothetical protein